MRSMRRRFEGKPPAWRARVVLLALVLLVLVVAEACAAWTVAGVS